MKIGVIGSGYEMLPLFDVLGSFTHEYHIFLDRKCRPRGDKSESLIDERLALGVEKLIQQHAVEKMLLPPVRERKFLSDAQYSPYRSLVIPLFTRYVLEYACQYSLVGKLGLLCDQVHMSMAERLMRELTENYSLTANQESTKSFQQPFALRKKEVKMRKYFLTTYGKRDRMVRKTLKYDLRYFKDAAVDTLIPLDWGMLFYQRMIKHMVNRKRIRFHGPDAIKEIFANETGTFQSARYDIHIHTTDDGFSLNKKRQSILYKNTSQE